MSTQPDSAPAATAEAPDKGVGCDALLGVNLQWHKGPAEGGTGTAGKEDGVDMWWDGDLLVIVVGTTNDREIALVSVNADEDQLSLTCHNTGDSYDAWSLSDVSWWAKLDSKTLPPRDKAKASSPNTERLAAAFPETERTVADVTIAAKDFTEAFNDIDNRT